MRAERQLTELEGAVLTEIALRGNDTAYKVRRAFQLSPSVQWRGSAGAVSPTLMVTAAVSTPLNSVRTVVLVLPATAKGTTTLT